MAFRKPQIDFSGYALLREQKRAEPVSLFSVCGRFRTSSGEAAVDHSSSSPITRRILIESDGDGEAFGVGYTAREPTSGRKVPFSS